MKKVTDRNLPYSSNKSKNYKADRLWLAVPLATASLVAGLTVTTNPVNAATNNINDALSTSEQTASDTDSLNSAKSESTSSNDTLENTSEDKDSKTVTAPADSTEKTSTTEDDAKTDNNTNTESNTVTTDDTSDSTTANTDSKSEEPMAVSQAAALSDSPSSTKQQPVGLTASASTESLSIVTEQTTDNDSSEVSSMPTARDIGDVIPDLANFYITVNSNIVLYNAKASAAILPYATNHMTANDPLFGFYIVLPISVTGNLAEFQTGADNYVKAQQKSTDISLSSLTVSQLGNTTDGRQVFYFRPDDNAHVTTPDPDINSGGTSNADRIRLELPISTGADVASTPKTITINAGNDAEVPVSDVLFAGIGDKVSTQATYKTIASSDLGIVAPDKNIVGISYTNTSGLSNAKTLTYTHINVTDSYIAWDNDTDKKIGNDAYKKIGQDGTTYDRSEFTSDPLKITKYFNANKYWYPSMTISEGTLTDTMVLRPTELQDSDGSAAGKTYYIYVDEIKTKLTGNTDKTINAGKDTTWNPDSNISIIAPDGKPIKISEMTGSGTELSKPGTYTYTDADNNILTVVSTVDPTKAGTYPVEYKYTDAQGNIAFTNGNTGATGAKSIVENIAVNDSSALSASNQNIVAGQKWPLSNGVTAVTDSNGNSVDIPTAWGKSLTVTDSDGNPVTELDTSKAGTKTVTYHYTDPTTGKIVDSDPVTITISDNISKMETKPLNIKKGDTWTPADNIKSLTDSDGTPVTDLSKADITESYFTSDGTQISDIDTSKPGQYTIKYSYTDSTGVAHDDIGEAQLNVIQDSIIETNNTTMAVGKTWNPTDNISGIIDPYGNQVVVDQVMNNALKYTGDVDTDKVGTYTVTYTYNDGFTTISKDATVRVIDDNSQITVPDATSKPSTIISGPNMPSWNPIDGVTLVDDNDPEVTASSAFADKKLTYKIVGPDGNAVSGNKIDNNTPAGVYEVKYSYTDSLGNEVLTSTTVTINASDLDVVAIDKTITAGTAWTPADDITSLVDETGNNVTSAIEAALKDGTLKVSITDANGNPVAADNFDTSKSGVYNITYTYKDSVGNVKTANSKLTIRQKSSGGGSSSGNNSGNGNGDSGSGSGNGSGTGSGSDSGNGTGTGSGSNTGNGNNSSDNNAGDSGNGSITSPGNNLTDGSNNNAGVGSNNNGSNVESNNSSLGNNNTQAATSNSNASNQANSTDNESNIGRLPQTGEHATMWYSQLGMFLLTVLGLFGFKRKKE